MVDVAVTDGVVHAVDVAKNEVRFDLDGWAPAAEGPALGRRVDTAIAGTVASITFREATVWVESDDGDRWEMFDDRTGPFALAPGRHLVQVGMAIRVYVSIDAASALSRDGTDGSFTLSFAEPAPVTIGFRSRVSRPRGTVTVPRTFDGAVAAIRCLSAAMDTGTPDKSYPTRRAHPPAIEFGDDVAVPEAVDRDSAASGITVSVPPSIQALLVAAPLVYYLRADVAVSSDPAVRVTASALPEPLDLGRGPSLEVEVAALLERVFYLDCLVRNVGPYGVELRELELLGRLDLDPEALYGSSEAERLASYLRAEYSAVAPRLPDWHLSAVVDPTLHNVRAVPYLLDRLALVQRPAPRAVPRQQVIAESVAASFQSTPRHRRAGPTYDLVRNRTRLGTHQGWLSDGSPVDAFRLDIAAFEHRFDFLGAGDGTRRVLVVINDERMIDERAGVEEVYRDRAAALSMDVTVVESLTREELREALESPVDFLHYIGHCEASGLRCRDGTLSTARLAASTVQTFFLNACGSFDQGLELVRRGSVAGAVTLGDVLNPEASKVGVTFARLLMHGFDINDALSLASRQSLANKFYTVVGDGTHRLSQGEDTFPAYLTAAERSTDTFDVEFQFPQVDIPGGLARPAIPRGAEFVLRGGSYGLQVDRDRFVAFLRSINTPVIYGDAFHWSTELAERLDRGSSSTDSA